MRDTTLWIEVNIECPSKSSKAEFLIDYVKPVIDNCGNTIDSWHFLWEGRPYPLTLMVRFCGKEDRILDLSIFLENTLNTVTHCYGRHGDCETSEEYDGEADSWGEKSWERGIKFLEFGSEFALELVENRDQLGNSKDYEKDAFFIADRYTHLFLNQISSLLNESDFYLLQGIFRYACKQGISISSERIKIILQQVKQSIR